MDARATLVYEAIRFAAWAAGQGLAPTDGEPASAPEDFLIDYSIATGEEEWETLAERVAASMHLMRGFEHAETAVIMDLTTKLAAAARRDMAEARALSGIITDLVRIYPEAAAEIAERYPVGA